MQFRKILRSINHVCPLHATVNGLLCRLQPSQRLSTNPDKMRPVKPASGAMMAGLKSGRPYTVISQTV